MDWCEGFQGRIWVDDQLAYLADEEYGRRGMIFFFGFLWKRVAEEDLYPCF